MGRWLGLALVICVAAPATPAPQVGVTSPTATRSVVAAGRQADEPRLYLFIVSISKDDAGNRCLAISPPPGAGDSALRLWRGETVAFHNTTLEIVSINPTHNKAAKSRVFDELDLGEVYELQIGEVKQFKIRQRATPGSFSFNVTSALTANCIPAQNGPGMVIYP
jgi:hypothetical protein